jgi:hypothetical protein
MTSLSTLRVTCLAVFALATSAQAQFSVRGVDAPAASPTINNIDQAETFLASQPTAATDSPAVINYFDGANDAAFAGGTLFPVLGNTDHYALEATAFLTFNTAGSYVFRVNSDDGFRLRFDGTVVSEFAAPRPPGFTDTAPILRSLGSVTSFRLTYFEQGGGDEVEFSYSLDGSPQRLVGTSNDITVRATPTATVPEPATTLGLLGLSMVAIVAFRSRSR